MLDEIVAGELNRYIRILLGTLVPLIHRAFWRRSGRWRTVLKTQWNRMRREKLIRKLYADGVAVGEKMAGFKERLLKLYENQKTVGGSYAECISESAEVQSGIFSEIDRLTLVTFIDRILIYEDDRIEIVFKYGKEIGTVADMARNMNTISGERADRREVC